MKLVAVFLAAMFLCLANVVMAEETVSADKLAGIVMVKKVIPTNKLDIRIFSFRGSSNNSDVWYTQDGFDITEDSTKRMPGTRVDIVRSFNDIDKLWGKSLHYQLRLSYQNYRATSKMWTARAGENGWENEKFFDYGIRHDSVSLQALTGVDILRSKDWSLRLFIPPVLVCPGIAVEKNNKKYSFAYVFSYLLEFKVGKTIFETGCGYKLPITRFGDRNTTQDLDWYVGAGYQIW